MDTRYLESFLQVATMGSTAEAARHLNLTPTAVAQRIKSLEHEIGISLLRRSGRTMKLTAAGEALVEPAKNLIGQARDLRAIASLDSVTGDLKIGCISSSLGYVVPDVLTYLITHHEHLRPHLEPGISTSLYRKVAEDELDVAVLVPPPFRLSKEFQWTLLHREPFVVLAPCEFEGQDAFDVLRKEPFIRYHRRSWGGMLADQYLSQSGVYPEDRFEIDTLDAIAAMVRGHLGVSLVPLWKSLHSGMMGLVHLPLPTPSIERPIGVLWKRSSSKERLIKVFLNALIDMNTD